MLIPTHKTGRATANRSCCAQNHSLLRPDSLQLSSAERHTQDSNTSLPVPQGKFLSSLQGVHQGLLREEARWREVRSADRTQAGPQLSGTLFWEKREQSQRTPTPSTVRSAREKGRVKGFGGTTGAKGKWDLRLRTGKELTRP